MLKIRCGVSLVTRTKYPRVQDNPNSTAREKLTRNLLVREELLVLTGQQKQRSVRYVGGSSQRGTRGCMLPAGQNIMTTNRSDPTCWRFFTERNQRLHVTCWAEHYDH
ncbi:hypothetical protein ILYODFUR_039163 [Ilyodon furcidens]|uniref:Uncharacterized protein n=1 Tax=Ilyodon furcidens TaxID=33524 RepID=A0ABV0V124_9TELE